MLIVKGQIHTTYKKKWDQDLTFYINGHKKAGFQHLSWTDLLLKCRIVQRMSRNCSGSNRLFCERVLRVQAQSTHLVAQWMGHFLVKEEPKLDIWVSWKTILLNRERYFGSLPAVLGRNYQNRTFTKSVLFLLLNLIIPPLSSINLCQDLSQLYLTHEVLTKKQQLHLMLRGPSGKSVLLEIIPAKFLLRDSIKWGWVYVCHHWRWKGATFPFLGGVVQQNSLECCQYIKIS